MIDKEMHDGFWDDILDALPDNIEIGLDERSDEVYFHFVAHGQLSTVTRYLATNEVRGIEYET
jgi:hypothetical protein